jgi:histone-binding protein RBBP4
MEHRLLTAACSAPADGLCKPDIRLTGHKNEGYGLSWSHQREGYLLSGSDDAQICVWDVKGTTQSNRVGGGASRGRPQGFQPWLQALLPSPAACLRPAAWPAACPAPCLLPPPPLPQQLAALHIFQGHGGVVEDVAWHPRHGDLFGSVGDDKKLIIWDLRKPAGAAQDKEVEAHTGGARAGGSPPA